MRWLRSLEPVWLEVWGMSSDHKREDEEVTERLCLSRLVAYLPGSSPSRIQGNPKEKWRW